MLKFLSKISFSPFQDYSSSQKNINSDTHNNNNNYYNNNNNYNNSNNYSNYLASTLYPKLSQAATSRGAGTRNSTISIDSYYSSSSSNNTLYEGEEEIKEIIPMTTICVEQEIHRVAFKTLQQCADLLRSLPNDEGFVYESKHVPLSTIGKHVRHVCDHFKILFESKPLSLQRLGYTTDKYDLMDKPSNWNLDYDNRTRKSSIETSRMIAIKQIEQLQSTITNDCTTVPLSTPINISVTVDSDPLIDNSVPLQSTYGRELWFCCLHAIHHYALIRVICIEQDLSYPENFGIAPSTIKEQDFISE